MTNETSYEWRKRLMWGLLLIAVGVVILLHKFDVIEFNFRDFWHYSPLVLVIIGINKMIGFPTARDFTSGLWLLFTGLWLFAVFEHLFGLDFGNAWPIPIIFSGVVMIIEPFIKRRLASNTGAPNEK